jgi:dihydrofolate reductase
MGKIVISENTSLDGVIQDPTGTEGFRLGGWFSRSMGSDGEAWAKDEFAEALGSAALLMGRRTYEWFVALGWAARSGEWADRLRSLPKYVVSSTLTDLSWANAQILTGDLAGQVSKLRRELDGDIVVHGSGRLAHALIEHDLVDEVRLMIFPCVLGEGERLFGAAGQQQALRLADTRTVGDGLVRLTYQRTAADA